MKKWKCFSALSVLLFFATPSPGGEEAQRLLQQYDAIETVTCSLRRTVDGKIGKIRYVSRIYYQNDGRLHAENFSPVKRRTIADGEILRQYAEGDPKGFSRPIDELSEQMRISLFKVPGTPMEHLMRVRKLEEQALPEADGFRRVGIDAGDRYVVLQLDKEDRLAGVEYFTDAGCTEKTAAYHFVDFEEVLPGVWVPMRHEAELNSNGNTFEETVVVDRFIANRPIAPSLFIAASFFGKDIDFVDDFSKIYPE